MQFKMPGLNSGPVMERGFEPRIIWEDVKPKQNLK
jgi:hypothetical protein